MQIDLWDYFVRNMLLRDQNYKMKILPYILLEMEAFAHTNLHQRPSDGRCNWHVNNTLLAHLIVARAKLESYYKYAGVL